MTEPASLNYWTPLLSFFSLLDDLSGNEGHPMLCRLGGGCPDGVSCDYAHSAAELQEWLERRDFLRQKLAKAREDMLIMPDELDFGKFNFLLQD